MNHFPKSNLTDWENLVKKQLKTEDIYSVLKKSNLENIDVRPYYDTRISDLSLPKFEENTHLVADYHSDLENDVLAFLSENTLPVTSGKTVFTENESLLNQKTESILLSLIDPFKPYEISEKNTDTHSVKNKTEELTQLPITKSICIDVALHQNAGASIQQQLAFALLKTKEIIELSGKNALKKIIFRLAVGHQYFFEIAKLRAFKILFHNLCHEFEITQTPYLFVESSTRSFSKNDEENNLIRSTLALSAAMIGGADAVYSSNYKQSLGSDLSQEISFKQQIVLAYESIINVFPDGASGSYYVEELSHQIAEKSWDLFLELENQGGYLKLLSEKKIQAMIYNQALLEQQEVDLGHQKLIGINQYPKLEIKKPNEALYSSTCIKKVGLSEKYED